MVVQSAINTFLSTWTEREDYIGCLLTGSFATNTADNGSDIDLRVILNDLVDYHEFGECEIEGITVSFIGKSFSEFEQNFLEDLSTTSKFEIRRFTVGRILDDPTGVVTKLKERAHDLLLEDLRGLKPVARMSELLTLSRKYKVFMEMPEDDIFYDLAYYDLLQALFIYYTKVVKTDIPVFIKKWSRYINSEEYRRVHHLEAYSDQRFIKLFLIANKKVQAEYLTDMYQYILLNEEGYLETDYLARFYMHKELVEIYNVGS